MLQSWTSQVITLVVFLVTARFLGPEAFGSVVVAYATVGALQTLVDLGMGDALLRVKDAGQKHSDAVFWTLVATSLVMFAVVCATSGLVARALRQPPLEWIMVIVAVSLPVYSLGVLPSVLLRRNLHFKPLAQRTMLSIAVGGIVGIAMAATGFGYWALVVKGLVESAIATLMVWQAVDYRPTLAFDRPTWRALFKVGRPLTMSRLVDMINQRADTFILSSQSGPAQLGLYAAAQRMYRTLMDAFFMAIQRVALPAFAQIADDRLRTRQALLRMLRLTSFFTFPLFAFVGVLADPLVPLLFGARWAPSAPILSAFCAAGLLFSVSYYNGPLMTAAGRTDYVMYLMIANTVLNLVAFTVGVRWGPLGVAVAFAIRGYVTFPANIWLLHKTIGLPVRDYARTLLPNLLATLLSLLAAGFTSYALVQWSPMPRLAIGAAVAIAVQITALFILFPRNLAHVLREASALVRAPRVVAALDTVARAAERMPGASKG